MEEIVKERETTADEDIFLIGDDDDESTQANKYLLFNLKDELYGVAIANVTEIIEMQKITEVPDMPGFVKGVINLRGRVIPVMDLRLRFGMEERPYDDRTCVIIGNISDASLGFIVDTVAEVHDILETNIEPPPNFKTDTGRRHYIAGLGKVGDRVTILIDVQKILRERELNTIKKKI